MQARNGNSNVRSLQLKDTFFVSFSFFAVPSLMYAVSLTPCSSNQETSCYRKQCGARRTGDIIFNSRGTTATAAAVQSAAQRFVIGVDPPPQPLLGCFN
jgi:hypothetical protein